MAKKSGNTIWIRWAPTSPYVWKLGNQFGYIIERYQITAEGKFQENFTQLGKPLSTQPIKPNNREDLKKLAITEDKAEILSEILYGNTDNEVISGETPNLLLKKNQALENRFGMGLLICDLSRPVAIAAGLMWYDQVNEGNRYAYRVKLARKPKGVAIEDGTVVIDATSKESPLIAPDDLEVRFDDKSATLKWPVLLHRGVYTAYIIEKSTDGKNYKAVSDLPYTNLSDKKNPEFAFFVDSLENNEQMIYYRIKGISPFAEISPSSKVVMGHGKEPLDAIVVIDSSMVINKKNIWVHWRLLPGYEKNVKGFYVCRSNRPDGPFDDLNTTMIPNTERSYIHKFAGNQNYYRIRYISNQKDKSGNDNNYYSFTYLAQVADETPPKMPSGLKGGIDTSGVVTLQWQPNKDNDLMGYRIFRANSLKEEFKEITRNFIVKNKFKDTVNTNTLTKKVYYRIVAIDRNFNPSEYSEIITLKRPDKIAPVAPVFRKIQMQENLISIQWVNSTSDDVAKYEIYRKSEKNVFKLLGWPVKDKRDSIIDTEVVLGKKYRYELRAIDSAGNIGSTISKEVFFESGLRDAVNLNSEVNREKNVIVLKWDYKHQDIIKFVIYKAFNGQDVTVFKTLNGNDNLIEDKEIRSGNRYRYMVKAFMKGGLQSEMSKTVTVDF